MSMRIITPLGKLCVVKKAVPLVSKQFEFNSSDRFLCEVCKEEGIANGIALDIGDKDSYGLCYDLVICNLPYEKVNDIFYHLLVDGWHDFGVWEYQNVEFFTEIKFAENSLPYTSEITMLGNPVFCKPKGLSHDELDEC